MRRRTFLAAGLATVATGAFAGFALYRARPDIPSRPDPDLTAARGWIVHRDGGYILHLPRIEFGQNIATALKQIACEELGIGWDDLTVEMQTSGTIAPVRSTVGSESVMLFAVPLAQACAALRDALAAGHAHGEIPVAERPYGALRAFRSDARLVGARPELVQGRAIVTGAPLYAADIRLDGMVYGRVLLPPVLPDTDVALLSFDEDAARADPGFVALVRHPLLDRGATEGLGIVARTPGALDRIAAALTPAWSQPAEIGQEDVDRLWDVDLLATEGNAAHGVRDGTVTTDSPFDVDLRIDTPPAAHAPIEPRAAVADMSPDGTMRLWVGHQDLFYCRDVVARRLGLGTDNVTVYAQRVGGAFGGKTLCTVELEAAVLSGEVGRPVKVQWTREQEFVQAFHRPPSSHRIRARVRDGQLVDWHHRFASSHILFTNAALPGWMQAATDLLAGDPGVARGSDLAYTAETARIEYDVVRLPIFTGPWRGLGAGPNTLAIEMAIDACADAAGLDPLDFRLRNLPEGRLRATLRHVADLAGWSGTVTTEEGGVRRGRGLACGIYKAMSYAATVADVSVAPDGTVSVDRLVCSHDCGRVINPDQVRAQCEGNLLWGLAFVLSDRLDIADGRPMTRDFLDGPIPTISQTPAMEIGVIGTGDPPTGAGETAIVSAMGAIANAIRAATGIRIERFPVDQRVLAV